MKITVREIHITSKSESTFYLKIEWVKDLGSGFVVLLCDGVAAWSGEVSEEDISREAHELEMSKERYVHDLQVILTGEGEISQSYSFHLAPEQSRSPILQLCYEKVQSGMSFRFGMVDLLPVPEPTKVVKELISYCLGHSGHLQAKNQNILKENQRLRNQQVHITAEMERYVREKETLETDLYKRFVLILNEKKAKICTLQERISELQNIIQDENHSWKKVEACHDDNEQAEEKLKKSKCQKTTDQEEDGDLKSQNLIHNTDLNRVLASNPVDDSLKDIADVAPSRKRRQRRIQSLESQTKRLALEQKQTLRSDMLEQANADMSEVPFQQPKEVNPNPDDLFDDI